MIEFLMENSRSSMVIESHNDLCISNIQGLHSIDVFEIHEIPFNFSDHLPVSLSCHLKVETESLLKLVSADILSERGETQQKRPRQLEKKCINWDAFRRTATLNLQTLRHILHNNNNFNQDFINDCFEHLEKCLYSTAQHCIVALKIDFPYRQYVIYNHHSI